MAKQCQTRSGSPSTKRSQPHKKKVKDPPIKKSPSPNSLSQRSNTPHRAGRKSYFTDEELLDVPEFLLLGPSYQLQQHLKDILSEKKIYSEEQLRNMIKLEFVSRIKTKIKNLREEEVTQKEIILLRASSFQSTPKHNQGNFDEISPQLDAEKESSLFPSYIGSANNNIHEDSLDRISRCYCARNETESARDIREACLSVSKLELTNFQDTYIQKSNNNLEKQSIYFSTNQALSWYEYPSSKDISQDSYENQQEMQYSGISYSPNCSILVRDPVDISEFFENQPPINFLQSFND